MVFGVFVTGIFSAGAAIGVGVVCGAAFGVCVVFGAGGWAGGAFTGAGGVSIGAGGAFEISGACGADVSLGADSGIGETGDTGSGGSVTAGTGSGGCSSESAAGDPMPSIPMAIRAERAMSAAVSSSARKILEDADFLDFLVLREPLLRERLRFFGADF